jgi:hypothetical protein
VFANVLLPALLFFPPALVIVLGSEVAVYWWLFRRDHRFGRVVRVVVLVNLVSTLLGWVFYPPATAIPPPNPMAAVRIPSDESPEETATARTAITGVFAEACGWSILIEGIALAVVGREFAWRRSVVALVASNVLSYSLLWACFLAITGRAG